MPFLRTACVVALSLLSFSGFAEADDSNLALEAFRRKAQVRLAESALASHDIETAQERLESALTLARKTKGAAELVVIYERLGDIYVRRNQLRGARSFYTRALQAANDDDAKVRTLERLSRLASRRGRLSEAVDWSQQSIAIRADFRAYLRLGEALLASDRKAEAADAFDQSVALAEPAALADLHAAIGRRFLWLANDPGTAKAYSDRALDLHTRDPLRRAPALRTAAFRAPDDAAAEPRLAQLTSIEHGAALAHELRARRSAAKDLEQAITEQQSAVALLREQPATPLLAGSLERLAKLEERRGQDGAAASLRREALDLHADRPGPAVLASIAALAANLERSGDSDAAESLWEEYIDGLEDQSTPEALAVAAADERFGDFLLRQDRFEEAIDRYEHAVEMRRNAWGHNDGGLQLVLEKLADALRLDGREEDAKRSEAQLALLGLGGAFTRAAPRGPRDTGTWLSEPLGIGFVGLALCAATLGLVWVGWSTATQLQPAIEETFSPRVARLAEAPDWKSIALPEARYPLSFQGRGGALFGIWSVNMALTLLTLGVYFFWGKIRVRRYFWGQAELAGDRFAFHGTGRELLFGWLKAAPVLVALLWGPGLLNLASDNPRAGLYGAGIALVVVGTLWPLAEIGASRYRLSRTSWRAVRFSFCGDAWPYMKLWLGGMALWILTLGLWAPFFDAARRRYLMANTRFGDARFECDVHGRDLFAFHLVSWTLFLPTAGASYFWYKALAERYFWSRTQLVHNEDASRTTFECSLKGIDLLVLWIQTMCTLAFTLGLGWPWTRVWEARLRLQTIAVTGDFRPGRIRQSASSAGAAGEGAADFLGLDFGFFS